MSRLGGSVFESKQESVDKVKRISDIAEVLTYIENLGGKRVICAFDWDNTISERNGCDLPLRDGIETIQTFDDLNKMGVQWFISTSRYAGVNVETQMIKEVFSERKNILSRSGEGRTFNECIRDGVKAKYVALPALKGQAAVGYSGINPSNVVAIKLRDEKGLPDTALIYGNVVYSGGGGYGYKSNKGRAFVRLMANGILPAANMFDVFIFVDNDMPHIEAVISEFDNSGFGDKVLALHYPQLPSNLPANELCGPRFDLEGCLINTNSSL